MLDPRGSRPRRDHPVWALFGLLALACSSGSTGPDSVRPNVVVIVVDTLGARHLSSYGADTGTTPHVDNLAAQGVRFERAYSTAPWTQPSIASLFTSRMPFQHGVTNLFDRLPKDATTLAERFARAGYRTLGVVSHFIITKKYGFDQGFETFDPTPITDAEGFSAKNVTDRAIALLERADERPFFLFAHYFDPHSLYNHHPEYDRTADYEGKLSPAMGVWEVRDQRAQFAPEDVEYLVGLYREEIAYTDHHVGRLLAYLDEAGLSEDTLVVFTADHGEEFMEHGWIGHTRTLYDELIRVPLIMRLPGVIAEGQVVTTPASIIDIAPTLVELCLGPDPGYVDAGASLAALVRGQAKGRERALFAEVSFDSKIRDRAHAAQKSANKTAILAGDKKLIHDLEGDQWLLFDRGSDARELRNLWNADDDSAAKLKATLVAWEAARGEIASRTSSEVDPAEIDRLKKLGYVR